MESLHSVLVVGCWLWESTPHGGDDSRNRSSPPLIRNIYSPHSVEAVEGHQCTCRQNNGPLQWWQGPTHAQTCSNNTITPPTHTHTQLTCVDSWVKAKPYICFQSWMVVWLKRALIIWLRSCTQSLAAVEACCSFVCVLKSSHWAFELYIRGEIDDYCDREGQAPFPVQTEDVIFRLCAPVPSQTHVSIQCIHQFYVLPQKWAHTGCVCCSLPVFMGPRRILPVRI